MKKFLTISLMAVLLLSSCTKENVIERSDDHAIVFENTFVDKATRADITNDNINQFSVYGYINNAGGTIWENERVYKVQNTTSNVTTKWEYKNLAYWQEGNSYYFHAFAPYQDENRSWDFVANDENGAVTGTIKVNEIGDDLIYAHNSRAIAEGEIGSNLDPIKLSFSHLMTRFRFKIVNDLSNENSSLSLSNVRTKEFPAKGEAKVPFNGEVSWTVDDTQTKSFVFASANDEIVIEHRDVQDGNTGYYVTEPIYVFPHQVRDLNGLFNFNLAVYFGSERVSIGEIASKIDMDFTFKPGYSYLFVTTIDDKFVYNTDHIISFDTPIVEEWDMQYTDGKDYPY